MFKPIQLTKILKRFDQLPKASLEAPLRKAEEEQETLWQALDHLTGGIIILDKTRPVYLNHYALNYFGISETSDLRAPLDRLITKEACVPWLEREILSAEQGFRNRLFFIGSSALVASLEGGQGVEGLRYFTFIDISENLDQFAESLRTEKIESLSRLIAYVAHEIKNPLHSLQLHLKILENELVLGKESSERAGRLKKTLGVLQDETKRLDGLTHQFLKLGQFKSNLTVQTDVNRLLESVLEVIRPELETRGAELLTAFDKRLPKLRIPKEKMYQAFLNLAKNAIEALPKKSGKLAVRTALLDGACRIEFRDNGSGIAPKDLDRIFEPYFSTKAEGSGLGLVFVKDAVEDQGGSIQVESPRGKGSIFTIFIPLKKEQLKLPRSMK